MIKILFILFFGLLSLKGTSQKPFFDLLVSSHEPIDGNEVEMIPYRSGDLYGFVRPNKPKQVLIKPMYKVVQSVYLQGAIVDKGQGFGLVDSKNKILIPLEYGALTKDGDFFHAINYGSKEAEYPYHHFFYNLKGELVFSQEAKNEVAFGNNAYAWFDYQDAIIVKNTDGFAVSRFPKIKRQFCLGIHNNYTCFRTKLNDTTVYSAYTHLGDLAVEIPIVSIPWLKGFIELNEGFYLFESSPNNRTFRNEAGWIESYRARLSSFELKESSIVERGTIRIGDGKREVMGVINMKGDTIIPFEYSRIYTKVNRRYIAVEKESQKMVVLDESGLKLSEFDHSKMDFRQQLQVLNEPIAFFDGLAIARIPVLKGDSLASRYNAKDSTVYYFTYFNQKDETIIRLDPKYTFVGNFSDGLAAVADVAGNLGFINTKGEWAIEPQFKLTIPKYGFDANDIPKFKGGFAYIKSVKGYIDKQGRHYYDN
ncbi:MAG: hypothetical protein GQ574_13100 [Crocinitomix sp.]|nr:hypothetical protein [Crocinitomix sp.]